MTRRRRRSARRAVVSKPKASLSSVDTIVKGRLTSEVRWSLIERCRYYILAAALLGIFGLSYVGYLFRVEQGRVTIDRASGLYLISTQANSDDISPTCGCVSPHPNEWRGVTLLSQRMTLTGHKSAGQISMIASFPAPVENQPASRDLVYTEIEVVGSRTGELADYTFEPDGEIVFAPTDLLAKAAAKITDRLDLAADRDITILNPDKYPVVSLIAPSAAAISMDYQPNEFESEERVATSIVRGKRTYRVGAAESGRSYTSFELVSTNLIVFYDSGRTIADGRPILKVAQIRVPFALAVRIPQPTGTTSTEILFATVDNAFYSTILARKLDSRMTTVAFNGLNFGKFTMRYPYAPPRVGVNVYGHLSDIGLHRADGSLMIDGEQRSFQSSQLVIEGDIDPKQTDSYPLTQISFVQEQGAPYRSVMAVTGQFQINDNPVKSYLKFVEGFSILTGIASFLITSLLWLFGLLYVRLSRRAARA